MTISILVNLYALYRFSDRLTPPLQLRDKCIMALGTLKDHPSVLPALLASLEDPTIAEPVTCSLYLATGDRKCAAAGTQFLLR